MKQTIIPAGTPGTFRPGFGQFPEAENSILAWIPGASEPEIIKGWQMSDHVYAWQYAPAAPLVDDFEAFIQKWDEDADDFPYFYAEPAAILYVDGKAATPTCFTLLQAQRAAYEHFLESLKD